MQNFAEYVNHERNRLETTRNKILDQIGELDAKRANVDRELSAIAAYEDAKAGKAASSQQQRDRGRHDNTNRRRRRGSRRDTILSLVGAAGSAGLKRGEILERMGLKGDKSGEMSISNALTAMIKRNQISRENGKYVTH